MNEKLNDRGRTGDEGQFVIFELGRERYGININQVREIITMQELTSIPKAAEFIRGVINLRGKVIPVYDMAGKFGLEPRPESKSTRIMVVEARGFTVGIIVDEVSEVLRISQEVIEHPSGLVAGVSEQFIEGIAKCAERLVIILNLDSALAGADLEMVC